MMFVHVGVVQAAWERVGCITEKHLFSWFAALDQTFVLWESLRDLNYVKAKNNPLSYFYYVRISTSILIHFNFFGISRLHLLYCISQGTSQKGKSQTYCVFKIIKIWHNVTRFLCSGSLISHHPE